MRTLAVLIIVAGLLVAGLAVPVAGKMSDLNFSAYLEVEKKSVDLYRLQSVMRMLSEGRRPVHTFVDPTPGVFFGAGMVALGLIILAVRRPKAKALEHYPPTPSICPHCHQPIDDLRAAGRLMR